jgi:two-component system response regulator HydG
MKLKQPRLLIVDDEPDTCANLADIFDDAGYDVDIAHDGPSALELAERVVYDLALLDLKMPGMDGLELYRELRRISAGTVAIIVTAYASRETASAALNSGAWRVLPKPVDAAQLLELAVQALDEPLILIVDDDEDLCHSLWDVFRHEGYRVCMAHDVADAERRVLQRDFQAVLVDMKLPSGQGNAVVERIRKDCPSARTIVVTGFAHEMSDCVQVAVSAGADAVCYKPFDVAALLRTVHRLVTT